MQPHGRITCPTASVAFVDGVCDPTGGFSFDQTHEAELRQDQPAPRPPHHRVRAEVLLLDFSRLTCGGGTDRWKARAEHSRGGLRSSPSSFWLRDVVSAGTAPGLAAPPARAHLLHWLSPPRRSRGRPCTHGQRSLPAGGSSRPFGCGDRRVRVRSAGPAARRAAARRPAVAGDRRAQGRRPLGAVQNYEIALESQPDRTDIRSNLGAALRRARPLSTRASSSTGRRSRRRTDPSIRLNLALALYKAGRTQHGMPASSSACSRRIPANKPAACCWPIALPQDGPRTGR